MGGWLSRVAIALLLLSPLTASAVAPPSVIDAITGTEGRSIKRFTLRFSEPMVALGRPNGWPLKMNCPVGGEGRWVDPATFVWEFDEGLPGSTTCEARLKPELKAMSGGIVRGKNSFTIDSGGPLALTILPEDGSENIEEDQAFLVAANGPVERASVVTGAYCAVDGIGERIAVDLLSPAAVGLVLDGMEDWQRESFLSSAGLKTELPPPGAERRAALASIVGLKCRRPLPPGRDMALVWGASIRSPNGHVAGADRRFDFSIRQEFRARLTCSRVNAHSGCSPVEAIKVEFSAPVPRAKALAARLEIEGGRALEPTESGTERTLSVIHFKPAFPPSTTARLTLPADLRDESGRTLTNARRFPLDVAIAEAPPLVKFAAPFGILEAKEGGVLPVTVRGVEPALAQAVKGVSGATARIEGDDAAVADWVRRVAKAQQIDIREVSRGGRKVEVNHTGDTPLLTAREPGVSKMALTLPGKGRQFEVVGIPLSKPGFYVVELASPTLGRALLGRPAIRYVNAAALVTNLSVHFKWGRAGSLAWVTSLDDGAPVSGASVRVTDSCTGKLLASGSTDRFGRLPIESGLPEPTTSESCDATAGNDRPLMISARLDGDFSFALTSWGEGIRPYDFDLPYGWNEAEPIFHSVLDRTLLRAGETIHMKHVYRLPTPRGFRSGGEVKGTLVLQHRGSDTSFELPLVLGPDGIGETEWTAPKEAPSGDYDIQLKIGEETNYTGGSFQVDEYRLPSMRASVSGPASPTARPKQLPLDLFVGYLSGGGAAGAPVKLRTAFETLNDSPDGWDGWTFGGSAVREGTVALDNESEDPGQVEMPEAATIPLMLGKEGALRTNLDIPALPDSARMTVEMDYEDANGETLTASTSIPIYNAAVRLGIRPDGWLQRAGDMRLKVAALGLDGKTIRGQQVRIALYTREILSARRRLIGGFYAFDNSAKTTKLDAKCETVTDSLGLAECTLDPGVSGEVIAVATTIDADGNEARAVTSVYLAGDDDWWFGGDNGDRMDIIPDAKEYKFGETAKVQVRMPFREATALVTVEREGVLSSFVTTLSGKDPVVEVPMAGSYAPDVYISVMAVRGRVAGWRLWLTELAGKLKLPFFNGDVQPTALVDLAKPSYRIGIAKVKVGWEAHQLKVTVKPEREIYHVREQAAVDVQVLGPDGKPPESAEIAFAAVDEALLSLSPNDSWNLLDAMMGERPLSTLTATAQMQVVGKRHYGRKALPTGGGGGGDLSALARSDFRPMLLWRGRVPLDSDGRARLTVPLADALSSYKLVAIATAGDDLFGTGSSSIRTVQDLSLFSGVPPLVRTGDSFAALFTLRNGTDRPMKVTASATLEPAVTPLDPVTVTIPAGGAVPVSWPVTVPEGIGQLRWTVEARSEGGGAMDRVRIDEEVAPAVPEEVWGGSFIRAGNGIRFPVAAPIGALPGRGGIEVALTASPAPSLAGVRAYMAAYPYGCFEQRLSKAIALDDRGAWTKQMADLPAYLTPEGLLRYWPGQNQPGSIALTAYALSITAESGYAWPEDSKTRMIEALHGVVDGRVSEEGEAPADARLLRLSALAALARNGAATRAMLAQAAIPLRDMPTAMLADWLVTIDRIRGVNPAARVAAEQALKGRIVYEGSRLDLVDRNVSPWWMMVSDDEMALRALVAAIGRPGWDSVAPRMMIGAALRQQRGHWDTTPANAWGAVAVRRFAAAYPGQPTGITNVTLAGQSFAANWPKPAPIRFPLPASPSPLIFAHSGGAPGWAAISVRAAVPLTKANFAGYRIERQVSFLQRKRPDKVSRGDVIKVRIVVDAPVDRTWVVVEDPLPPGASIVSGGGQSGLLAAQAQGGNVWPSYIERSFGAWRGYFGWLPQGRASVEYAVRINSAGRFQLPPTRVEAMYTPEIHAAIPNGTLEVAP